MPEGRKKLFGFVFLLIILASGGALKAIKEKFAASKIVVSTTQSHKSSYDQSFKRSNGQLFTNSCEDAGLKPYAQAANKNQVYKTIK